MPRKGHFLEREYKMFPPGENDDFGRKIYDEFYDARVSCNGKPGSWAYMTPKSWILHGYGKLGTGFGQRYVKINGTFKKVVG